MRYLARNCSQRWRHARWVTVCAEVCGSVSVSTGVSLQEFLDIVRSRACLARFAAVMIENLVIVAGGPRIVQKKNRHSSGCDPMVVAEHSAEALSALNRVMG